MQLPEWLNHFPTSTRRSTIAGMISPSPVGPRLSRLQKGESNEHFRVNPWRWNVLVPIFWYYVYQRVDDVLCRAIILILSLTIIPIAVSVTRHWTHAQVKARQKPTGRYFHLSPSFLFEWSWTLHIPGYRLRKNYPMLSLVRDDSQSGAIPQRLFMVTCFPALRASLYHFAANSGVRFGPPMSHHCETM